MFMNKELKLTVLQAHLLKFLLFYTLTLWLLPLAGDGLIYDNPVSPSLR